MANTEHLEILKAGVDMWNKWRNNNKNANIDLSEADLSGTILHRANLTKSNLSDTNLNGALLSMADLSHSCLNGSNLSDSSLLDANLFGANLSRAQMGSATLVRADLTDTNLTDSYLTLADLSNAILCRADLSRSDLQAARLSGANLTDAILSEANLSGACLTGTKLENANFRGTLLDQTIFGLTNLETCQALDTVEVIGACIIDFQTLRASKNLPKSFLLKLGLPEHYIDYLPDFYGHSFLFPAFLSHSWKNKTFVRNLYEALIGKGVNVFLDEMKMKPGDDLFESITKGIQDYDKMILVCSKESLTESWWVDRELDRVFAKERELFKKHGKRINLLIPITVDDYIFEWKGAKAEEVRRYIIGDFRPEADFEKSLNDLVHALHVERPDVKPPSNY
ncbi:MAG: toll/interleukin-1 receptor domain-containing protein [Saprospiraceae bacterium]|nr:toll/interleukin-1 receptor domain-containing protein [Saprospiraceae bacterium]